MPFEFVPIESSEQSVLIHFLVNSFQADPALSSFHPDVIHWKYFTSHPDRSGPRSFGVKQSGEIVAHGGVWPIRLNTQEGEVNAIHLIDWAASRSAVGAGVYLLRKIAAMGDVLLTVGGSQDTRNLLPKLGYKGHGELRHYARVVRPWLHFVTTPGKHWKSPLKFVRDSARALTGIPPVPRGWTAYKIGNFVGPTDPAAGEKSPDLTTSVRTASTLNHLLQCPAAQFSGFLVRQKEKLRGYFLLSKVGHQGRIVDIRLNIEDAESWPAICNLAAGTAAADPTVAEIAAASSVARTQQAWLQAGFVHRQTDEILANDPRGLLGSQHLDLTLADGDQCFLNDPRHPYLL